MPEHFYTPHLSKGPNYLKKKCTQLPTPFSGTVFNALSLGVINLIGVLAWETTFSLVEILQQPIKNFHFKVFKANTPNKMSHTMWKSIKNCARKWCRKLCAFLFVATWAFGKMWYVKCSVQKSQVWLTIRRNINIAFSKGTKSHRSVLLPCFLAAVTVVNLSI